MSIADSSGARRDPELEPDPGSVNRAPGPDDSDPARREQRAEIGKYVSLVALPATAEQLIAGAQANGAPERVLDRLRGLRPGAIFETARDVWLALGLEAMDRF
jgi:hypothetical protein